MPTTPHVETHFTASAMIRDIVIGMSDGLTVPFALAAGLSGAVDTTAPVVTAGLAEVAAGAIAMGLGGYLAARTDAEHYTAERVREFREIDEVPHQEREEVAALFREYGLAADHVTAVVDAISSQRRRWVELYDAIRAGIRRTRRRPGSRQCADDRAGLRRRRADSAGALHARQPTDDGAVGVGGGDPCGAHLPSVTSRAASPA